VTEVYVSLKDAAIFEGFSYETLKKRIQRDAQQYKVKVQPRESGGKDEITVAVSSLSAKARKAWRAAQKIDGRDAVISSKTSEVRPWYVDADLNHYIEQHKQAYYETVELANAVQRFIDYDGDEPRATVALRMATDLGISPQSLYRHQKNLTEAAAWALKLEQEDGQNRDYFKVLSVCRKPREKETFPGLSPEQRALIENIWFSKDYAENKPTIVMLYKDFERFAAKRGWEDYPSIKTIGRYVKYLMDQPGAKSAYCYARKGPRGWRNEMMVKCRRETATLEVMEYVVGDEHTFDVWVQYTAPNGKVKAVRPVLVAWMDLKSRNIVGDVLCLHANSSTLKESLVKMIYTAGVPKILHIDNGKDYTSEGMTGQNRRNRRIDFDFDAETIGFYQSIGIEEVGRSLPYQPWDKSIERFFGTVCKGFSKWFKSYTGTLTGSKTDDKCNKDIDKMLARGELLTMEEFFDVWTTWKEEYNHKKHRGLKENHEKWLIPAEMFENGPRYVKAAPPREFAAMLLMASDTAHVYNYGINKFGTIYTDEELGKHVNETVNIKWDIDDVTKLYVYDQQGRKICEAASAELLSFGKHCSQAALEKHIKAQKRQEREVKEFLEGMTTPYEARLEEGRPSEAVGKLDLMIGHAPQQKVVALPADSKFRSETTSKKKKASSDEFFSTKAGAALKRLKAINE